MNESPTNTALSDATVRNLVRADTVMTTEIAAAMDDSIIRGLTRSKDERQLRKDVKGIELIAKNTIASHVIASTVDVKIQGIRMSLDEARGALIDRELQSTIELSSAAQNELAKSMTAHVQNHEATMMRVESANVPDDVKQRLAHRFSVARAKTMQETGEVFGVSINKPR